MDDLRLFLNQQEQPAPSADSDVALPALGPTSPTSFVPGSLFWAANDAALPPDVSFNDATGDFVATGGLASAAGPSDSTHGAS